MKLIVEGVTLALPDLLLEISFETDSPALGIFGPSGAGKTTLLEILAGLRKPQNGRIVFDDTVLTDMKHRIHVPSERRQIGYLPQDLALFPHLSVARNLFYGRKQVSSEDPILRALDIERLLDRPISGLSGGEKQRVAFARAFLAHPKLLLLDEPLASLDQRLKEAALGYLHNVWKLTKVPLIYVSHNTEEIVSICDQVIFLQSGKLVRSGPVHNMFLPDPQTRYIPAE